MHELSIASAIVESVLEFAEAHDVDKVLAVRLAIGEMTCIECDQLTFCYKAISQETPIAESDLEIRKVKTRVECLECSYIGPPQYWTEDGFDSAIPTLRCPQCGKTARAIQGLECALTTIRFVQHDRVEI